MSGSQRIASVALALALLVGGGCKKEEEPAEEEPVVTETEPTADETGPTTVVYGLGPNDWLVVEASAEECDQCQETCAANCAHAEVTTCDGTEGLERPYSETVPSELLPWCEGQVRCMIAPHEGEELCAVCMHGCLGAVRQAPQDEAGVAPIPLVAWRQTPSGRAELPEGVTAEVPAPEGAVRFFPLPPSPDADRAPTPAPSATPSPTPAPRPAPAEEPTADEDDSDTSFSWDGINTPAQCAECARSCADPCADATVVGCEVKHYSSDGPESYAAHRCVNCMDECLPD